MGRGGSWSWLAIAVLWWVGGAGSVAAQQEGEPNASLDRTALPAAGRQTATLTVTRFGRYAVAVKSGQGTSLQLVDRMAGPGEVSGRPGESDGRLDVFLEAAQYQVVARGHEKAKGEAQLAVHAFAEKNAPRPPQLVELKDVDGALGDFEQISYWVQVEKRRTLAFEAGGRNLADLRLWREGTWLVDVEPERALVQPAVGRPLRIRRLAADLEPGLYLLTAYGGPAEPWAEDDGSHPFHLRFGIPLLGSAARQRHVVGPLGIDRYRVPKSANYFRIELPEARPATLQVGTFDPKAPFAVRGPTADVTKKSLPPVAELDYAADGEEERILTVSAPAGQPYVEQHFEVAEVYFFGGTARHWVSTIHSGHPEDSVDVTALVTRTPLFTAGPRHTTPFLDATIELDGKTGWARRANLLDTLTLFVHVKEAGKYEALSKGTEARFRIEPFLTDRPEHYQPPPFKTAGASWTLDAGYYVLTIEPVKKGILDVALRPSGLLDLVLDAVGLARQVEAHPVRPAARFPEVPLDTDFSYAIYLNRLPEVRSGVVLRELPLDLTDPLPVVQPPGEEVSVPFSAGEAGTLRAEGEDGGLFEVSVDGGEWRKAQPVAPGRHAAAVRHDGTRIAQYALRLEPTRLAAGSPLPPLPDAATAALPAFPKLGEDAPRAFDLERGGTATFEVHATVPALFRLESSGLLATEGNLRTRTITSLARASQNGVGRNFLVQQYLREGEYQLSVAAQGMTRGHLGVGLERTRVAEGGFLTSHVPARASLPAGTAIAYRFVITKPGEFRVRALGLGRTFHCRLEDEDGWPVVPPGGTADLTRWFDPGRYRLVVLPDATDARVLTLVEPVARRVARAGHGPHRLSLARRVEHLWLEPEEGRPRDPDVWEFGLPAPASVTVLLTGEMQGRLLRVAAEAPPVEVAAVPPGRGFQGPLAAGRYRLEVNCVRTNNRAPYQVAVWPEELIPGLEREVVAPVEIPVSLGETSLVELSSFSSSDVRARLEDDAGRLVAASDDRPDDWNFLIARSLTAGRYRLRVDPVGEEKAPATIAMRVPREVDSAPLSLPAKAEVRLGRASLLYPLPPAPDGALLLAAVRSTESIGIALEKEGDAVWQTIGSIARRSPRLEVPLAAAGRYRLRVWALDRRDTTVRLSVAAPAPPAVTEARLAGGAALPVVDGLAGGAGAGVVTLERPGLLRVAGGGAGLRWSGQVDVPCAEASGLVPATGGRLWVVGDEPGQTVRASRATLASGEAVPLTLTGGAPIAADLAAGTGPLLVLVASQTVQPGVRVAGAGEAVASSAGMAVAPRAAAAAGLGGEQAAVVWAAEPLAEPAEVRLEAHRFAEPKTQDAPAGPLEGALDGGQARRFALEGGVQRIHIALDAGVFAALSRGALLLSVHGAAGDAVAETVESPADRVTFLHPGDGEARYSIERLPLEASEREPALAEGAPYERLEPAAGTLRLALAPGATPATLHVRGPREGATLVSASGRVARGGNLALPPEGGTLLLPHGPGLLLAWIDRPGSEAADLWSAAATRPATLRLPASVRLKGPVAAFRVETGSPALLHLRAGTPLVSLLGRGDGPPEVSVHEAGALLDAYLPDGRAELRLRALAGGTLSGSAEITATGVTPIDEGLGPEVLLPPGATRLFFFRVTREGEVGIGVRASADVVDATLLDERGHALGTGVVQMPKLVPGTYLLALRTPAGAGPIRARPALAGIRLPDTGPPEDVIRSYLAPEGSPAGFSAVHTAAPRREAGEEGEEVEEEGEGIGDGGAAEEPEPEADEVPDGGAADEVPQGQASGGAAC